MELPEIAAKLAVDDIVVFGRRDDELLLWVASVSCLRDADMVARVGGDEFAALLPDAEPSGVPGIIERTRASCAE